MSHLADPLPAGERPGIAGAVVWLHDAGAADPSLTGAKAANLAVAASAGLPVLPGFAITTRATSGGRLGDDAVDDVRAAWAWLAASSGPRLVVRSSSTAEDAATSSMAGQFESVLGVEGWDALLDALGRVLASAAHPKGGATPAQPMGVLVQPEVEAAYGGVLFGIDPVSGADRTVVGVVPGLPDALVSGTATAVHGAIGRTGRLLRGSDPALRRLVDRAHRRQLAAMARRAAEVFGRPQDVEWAVDTDGSLWLLQSRDVTAWGGTARAEGPVLGPGPVAETFPDPLTPLEEDLWLAPLRDGVAGALRVLGAVPRRRIGASPVVCTVGRRAAADLDLLGAAPRRAARSLSPWRAARRLVAAWRTGRLRAAMPVLAADLLAAADADLGAVPPLGELDETALVELLHRSRDVLASLHGHEVLAGMLLTDAGEAPSLPSVALGALRRARAEGLDDERAAARYPAALALVPPRIGALTALPAGGTGHAGTVDELGCRDALRLRCRWVQELSARAAAELGNRLAIAGVLDDPALVAHLRLDELAGTLRWVVPDDLGARAAERPGPPLPAAFRLSPDGEPVPVPRHGRRLAPDGLPAGGGRAVGVARHDPAGATPGEATVLVVDTLDPRLAGILGGLAGLVSETGSVLSHLAILAREAGVPTVVAVPDARRRFPDGCLVVVDGTTGEVAIVDEGTGP